MINLLGIGASTHLLNVQQCVVNYSIIQFLNSSILQFFNSSEK